MEAGAVDVDVPAPSNRILTVPNFLSLLRLLGAPVFLWLILRPLFGGPNHDMWALALLAVSGLTDYLDGKLARRWNQESRLGRALDPTADRLYILATLAGLAARHIIPVWFAVAVVARDLVLILPLGPVLRRHGYGMLPVNYVGKAATFNLLYAFPLLLLGGGTGSAAALASIFGWAFAWWGISLYWLSGLLYAGQTFRLARA